jgi:two-component sensor histidine kinase
VKFLIIDDHPGDRELIVQQLRKAFADAEFVEAARRQEFEAALALKDVDVVLTDYQLHWGDGLEILKAYRSHLPHIPVIMFTDTGSEEIAVEGMKAGVSDYILKSNLHRLPLAVKESIEKVRLRQAHAEAEAALRRAKEDLERQVEERTRELQELNDRLRAELDERRQVEAQLQAALGEKELLLRELHHRVKNNLQVISSLLDLQADVLDDPQVLAIFEDSQRRIQAMALIHESLYQSTDLARLNAADYLQRLGTRLCDAYGTTDDRIALEIHADEVWLEVNTAIACGLILQELLSNSFKHAFPAGRSGEIHITLGVESEHRATLTVRDTGVGFPEGVDFHHTDSLGLQLVGLLTEQLGGTIALEQRGGTQWTLTFPITSSHTDRRDDDHSSDPHCGR